ncbi:unnamed protein product [Adineta ricciae]|uniref:Uncharacterized protein n=1 Tax=Adineta ricciae TaxID=249248 RepID=A0A815QWZ4_ADIRI|nr:unnamed protein product [Adineta ricciae]CAF1683298.1 unnamed protein product [Adineta ricciae]
MYSKIIIDDSNMSRLQQCLLCESDKMINSGTEYFPEMPTNLHSICQSSVLFQRDVLSRPNNLEQFECLVVDITNRISPRAHAMLQSMGTITNSIIIINNSFNTYYNELSDKKTFLFASSQFVNSRRYFWKLVEKTFILEDDKTKVDNRQRFATGEHLMFQLANELYRVYKHEADECLASGDIVMAKKKEELANTIYEKQQTAYTSFSSDKCSVTPSVDTVVVVIWLNSKVHDAEVDRLRTTVCDVVSLFKIFNNEVDFLNYQCANKLNGTVFLIVSGDYDNSVVTDFLNHQKVKHVYRYGHVSAKRQTKVINSYNNLCFELLSDLAAHYCRLGPTCSAVKDTTSAKDMFNKAARLQRILKEL